MITVLTFSAAMPKAPQRPTLDHFLSDPDIVLAGYQPDFDDFVILHFGEKCRLVNGLILFNHLIDGCNTSMALSVQQFIDLSDRPILSKRTREPDIDSHLCMREGCFDPCPVKCECNWVREVHGTISRWPKYSATA